MRTDYGTTSRKLASAIVLATTYILSSPAAALPKADNEGTGQRSPLDRPPPTNPGGPGASTATPSSSAHLLVPGKYSLRVAAGNRSLSEDVQLARNANQVTLTTTKGDVLTGTVLPNGQFSLSSSSGGERITLTAPARANSASGSADLKVGTRLASGTFTLTEVQKQASVKGAPMQEKVKQFVEPGDRPKSTSGEKTWWQSFKAAFTL